MRLVARVLGLLFRVRCAGCRAWTGADLCPACAAAWPAAPAEVPAPRGVDAVLAGAPFAGPAAGAVRALKFTGRRALATPLAAPLAAHPGLPDAGWLLVPVPLPRARRRSRGYNQAKLLARAIARRRGHRVADLLRRAGGTGTQARLGRAARAENVAGAISCECALPGARVVLVDDVLTTGATAAACAAALRAAGAAEVVVAVATYTLPRASARPT